MSNEVQCHVEIYGIDEAHRKVKKFTKALKKADKLIKRFKKKLDTMSEGDIKQLRDIAENEEIKQFNLQTVIPEVNVIINGDIKEKAVETEVSAECVKK